LTGASLRIAEAGLPIPLDNSDIPSLVFSPDGTQFCTSSGDSLHIWDVRTGNILHGPLKGLTKDITVAIFSCDGKQLFSGSIDRTVWRWDTHSGTPVGVPLDGHLTAIISVISSPDGVQIISMSKSQLQLWDVMRGTCLGTFKQGRGRGGLDMIAFAKDGKQIILSDQESV
jgi:WD40 repeat protein